MGEVYRARDTKLGRDVALKILPSEFTHDPDRIARFKREAQVLASLNHPHIAAIYGLEEANASQFLVLELVEGDTLEQRIARGPIHVEEALNIARQVAEALEAAHEKAIIHRDLKPSNIAFTADDQVKVLDFGLAKALDDGSASSRLPAGTASPTITTPVMMTGVGMILGTAAYMSPEQAKGRPADKRSDVWAFGCVLFEMLTGKRAFEGEDVSDTLAAVLKGEPDWNALQPDVPALVRTLMRRCLEKDRKRRTGDVSAALFVLKEPTSLVPAALATPAPQAINSPQQLVRRIAPYAAVLLAAGIVAGAAVWFVMRPSAPHITRFAITPSGPAAVTAIAADRELAITPDGTHIVYVANNGTQLFVRALDQLEPTPLVGLGTPRGPFLSPDGKWIGFFDESGQTPALKKVAITGGPALPVCRYSGQRQGGTWGEDGTIIFATGDTSSGLWRVSAAGGEPTMLTRPNRGRGETDHLWPEFLPGGRAVLFTITPTTGGIENSQVAVLDLRTGTQRSLVRGGSHAHYVPSGHLVYGVAGTLRAVPFDLSRLVASDTPIPVLAHVVTTTTGVANFDIARDGTLVYVPGAAAGTAGTVALPRTLVWVDRQGREESISANPRAYTYPRISPDSTRVALDIRDQENGIWIWDLARETLTPFTLDPGLHTNPVWTPKGDRLVFSSEHGGNRNLFWQSADGTGGVHQLSESPNQQLPTSTSPDGTLVFTEVEGVSSIMMVAMDTEHRVEPLVQTSPFNARNGEVSPDGRWLAYDSTESGRVHIYVQPFPNVNGGRWQVGLGIWPVWSRNSQELFYMTTDGARDTGNTMMRVPVERGASWTARPPTPLFFAGRYFAGVGANIGGNGRTYDVSPDGQKFLMIKQAGSDQATAFGDGQTRRVEEGLVVVQNWVEELKRLVPTK
jgi:Tol biopolymer transport system component